MQLLVMFVLNNIWSVRNELTPTDCLVVDATNIYQGLQTVYEGIQLGYRYIKSENDSYWFQHRDESNKAVIIITDGE